MISLLNFNNFTKNLHFFHCHRNVAISQSVNRCLAFLLKYFSNTLDAMSNAASIVNFKFWIEGVTNLTIGGFGIVGNLLAIAVLLSKKLKIVKSIRYLLILLSAFDTLLLINHLVITCPGNWSVHYREDYE